ncbi:MAG: DUF1343 domain-containing protein [Bacteroidales bacterium]|nr:DUF1343 domain-containing protein [Bacteroidales bacterium]
MKKFLCCFILLFIACTLFAQVGIKWDKVNSEDNILSFLKDKRVALVCNHTSILDNPKYIDTQDTTFAKYLHRIDYLRENGINLVTVFTPEHGLTGLAEAGEKVNDSTIRNGEIKVRSLYGNTKKPKPEWLKEIDVVVFDLQDVGCRFYTYISTLEYVMQACIERDIPLVVYDRPNPNNYVDGPVLKEKYKSFVGMQPIPVCYGLTIGEYAVMINEEHWVDEDKKCTLFVVLMVDYDRNAQNPLPVPPSPNLRTLQAIKNYPTLCFFEGTPFSVGRGTDFPFETVFNDKEKLGKKFTIKNIAFSEKKINIDFIKQTYKNFEPKKNFFNSFFDKLAGTEELRQQIIAGKTEQQIRESWKEDTEKYLIIRNKYLIY